VSTATRTHRRQTHHPAPAPLHAQETRGAIATKVILGIAAVAATWAVLVTGVAMASEHLAGMLQGHAWAFALGIVSYIFIFTGFVSLLVRVISKDSSTTTT
jgi:hypothetical protein